MKLKKGRGLAGIFAVLMAVFIAVTAVFVARPATEARAEDGYVVTYTGNLGEFTVTDDSISAMYCYNLFRWFPDTGGTKYDQKLAVNNQLLEDFATLPPTEFGSSENYRLPNEYYDEDGNIKEAELNKLQSRIINVIYRGYRGDDKVDLTEYRTISGKDTYSLLDLKKSTQYAIYALVTSSEVMDGQYEDWGADSSLFNGDEVAKWLYNKKDDSTGVPADIKLYFFTPDQFDSDNLDNNTNTNNNGKQVMIGLALSPKKDTPPEEDNPPKEDTPAGEDSSEEGVTPAKFCINATKSLTGKNIGEAPYNNAFTFELTGSQGAPLPKNTKVNNNGAQVNFGEITFTKAGTYTYTVKEVKGDLENVTYDNNELKVTITVAQLGAMEKKLYVTNVEADGKGSSVEYEETAAEKLPDSIMVHSAADSVGYKDKKGGIHLLIGNYIGAEKLTFKDVESTKNYWIAYCLDYDLDWPSELTTGSNAYMVYKNSNSFEEIYGKDVAENVKKILYYGYPLDGSGEMLDYADTQSIPGYYAFSLATNVAVWEQTSPNAKITGKFDSTTEIGRIVNKLKEIIAREGDVPSCVDLELAVYDPTGADKNVKQPFVVPVISSKKAASANIGTFTNKYIEESSSSEVKITKTDLGGNEVAGAKIVVKDSAGKEIDSWTSVKDDKSTTDKNEAIHEVTLAPGTYTMEETVAPAGYEKIKTVIEFEVKEDGTVVIKTTTVENGEVEYKNGVIVLKDAPKDDEATEAPSEAEEKDTEKPSEAEEKDTEKPSEAEEKDTQKPTESKEKETQKPTESEDETTYREEEVFEVLISKKALGGEEIKGAHMSIYDAEGSTVEEWVSDTSAHVVNLKPGTYTLVETVAPEGFKRVETAIKFNVDEAGEVILSTATVDNGGKICVKDVNHLILEDAPAGQSKDNKKPDNDNQRIAPDNANDKAGPLEDDKDKVAPIVGAAPAGESKPDVAKAVATGDNNSTVLWITLISVAAVALTGAGFGISRRRKND